MMDEWLDGNLPIVEEIRKRLSSIVPGTQDPERWARRELAAKTVFVMLYGYAVEGFDRWIRPTAVADMTDLQAAQQNPTMRRAWLTKVQGRHRPKNVPGRWFSENTRESIRDETLRRFVDLGLVVTRSGLPTTSPKPRYALSRDFADLFFPELTGQRLASAIDEWQQEKLSATALARVVLEKKGASGGNVPIYLPSGETRILAPGRSSLLTRAAVEEFAPRFLTKAAAVMISESARKLAYQDEELLKAIGLEIDVSTTLPDIILADLGSEPPLIVFIECVVTDGPVSEQRKGELDEIALRGGYKISDCAYVTAFNDRAKSPYRRMAASLAWGTFAWFASEPGQIVLLRQGGEKRSTSLARLLERN